jgi:hypothetical protein
MAAALRRNISGNFQPHSEHFPLQLRHKNPRYHQQHRLSLCNQNYNAKSKHVPKKNPVCLVIFTIQPLYIANNHSMGRIRHPNSAPMYGFALFVKQGQSHQKFNTAILEHCSKAHFSSADWVATSFFNPQKPQKKPNLHLNFVCNCGFVMVFALQPARLDGAFVANPNYFLL